jgi:hypothetical protein
MAKAPKSEMYSFTKEEASKIYQEALELELDEDLDEEEWWGNYAPVFDVGKCWLSGDKDKAAHLVNSLSIPFLFDFDSKLWPDWDLAKSIPDSEFGTYLLAIENAFKFAGLDAGSDASLLGFVKDFPLVTAQAISVTGISCFFEGTIYCGGAHFSGIALDSDLEKESIFICRNFSEVRTGFDCYAALFRLEHSDFKTPIGFVVKSYGPWTDSFFGENLVNELEELLDEPNTQVPALIALDGINKATELNKPFVVTQKLGVTAVSLTIDDDQLEVDFQSDEIATYMPGTYRTFALNTDYAEITLDDDGDIDWNESATLFINEKALSVLGLSAK